MYRALPGGVVGDPPLNERLVVYRPPAEHA